MRHKLCFLATSFLLTAVFSIKTDAQTASPSGDVPRIISYQGQITSSDGASMNGLHHILATLYSDPQAKNVVWQSVYAADTKNGVFTIQLGLGATKLPGTDVLNQPLWIGIKVDGGGEMRPLSQLTSAPYALNVPDQSITFKKLAPDVTLGMMGNPTPQSLTAFHEITGDTNTTATMTVGTGAALRAAGTGTITANQFVGTGSTTNAVDLSTAEVNGILPVLNGGTGSSTGPWSLSGNSGTSPSTNYIGTSDSNAFEIHVFQSGTSSQGAQRVMRYEPNGISPNIIGGYNSNYIDPSQTGSTVTGGGSSNNGDSIKSSFSIVGSGRANLIAWNATSSIIGGGDSNQIYGHHSVIVGGSGNKINLIGDSTGSAGKNFPKPQDNNSNNGYYCFIGGGNSNTVIGNFNAIVGGCCNSVGPLIGKSGPDDFSFVGGGTGNTASEEYSVVVGGHFNVSNSPSTFIGSGEDNRISDEDAFPAGRAAICGGRHNLIQSNDGFIGGGNGNIIGEGMTGTSKITSDQSSIVGGDQNQIYAYADHCIIGGGYINKIEGTASNFSPGFSVIGGGYGNGIWMNSLESVIGGGLGNNIGDNTLASTINNSQSTISGGWGNLIEANLSTIGGGYTNKIWTNNTDVPQSATIAGGYGNTIQRKSSSSTIGGGIGNNIGTSPGTFDNSNSVISGGWANTIENNSGVIGGGYNNYTHGIASNKIGFSIIGGGRDNSANAFGSTIPGGVANNVYTYGQFACGFLNEHHTTTIPQTALDVAPSVANTDAYNGQLFMIGNGAWLGGGESNAFEVSYNGHSIVYDNNGATRASIRGATYQDNVVNAWGRIHVAGAAAPGVTFGVSTVQYIGIGNYNVILNITDPKTGAQIVLSDGAVNATITDQGYCRWISVSQLGSTTYGGVSHTSFTITIKGIAFSDGTPYDYCHPTDNDFMFTVVGRQ